MENSGSGSPVKWPPLWSPCLPKIYRGGPERGPYKLSNDNSMCWPNRKDLYKITLAAAAITGMAAAGGVEGGWRGANVTINLLSYPF